MTEEITKNHFEEVIDNLMLDQYSDEQELTEFIKTLPNDKKRLAILSLLDKDNNMWTKLKTMIGDNTVSKMDHIKDVVLMLREYVKIAEVEKKKFGEVMTPLDLVKEMLATLPKEVWSNPDLKWLDPANGTGPYPIMVIYKLMKGLEKWQPNEELRYKHIIENMIYVCEIQPKNMFLYLCAIDPKDEYDCNIYTGSFLEEGFDKHMKEVWNVDNFDIVIGNPPYKRKMNLKFLNKAMSFSEKSIFVHPSSWLIDEKDSNSEFRNSRILHSKSLSKVRLFNGNKIFGIGLYIPCAITYIDKSKGDNNIEVIDDINNCNIIYNDINDINKFSNLNEYKNIISKVKNFKSLSSFYNKKNGNWYVNMSRIRGHVYQKSDEKMYCDDFYTTITKDEESSNEIKKTVFFSFSNRAESDNFIKYMKTNFFRFCLSICKNSADLNKIDFSMIPWLDFSREWTDDDLIKEFELTKEEVDFIKKHIPKYY